MFITVNTEMFTYKSLFLVAFAHWSWAAPITKDISCEDSVTYNLGNQKVTWTEAYLMCKENGMELASITSNEEQSRLSEVLLATPDHSTDFLEGYWLAGIRRGGGGPDFVWLTTMKSMIFRHFAPGQPDNHDDGENCLQAFFQTDSLVMWNDNRCQARMKFVCQSRKHTNCR